MKKVIIVGAGIFGITGAVELIARGYDVHVMDPGPIPHPDASSTDISKVLRMDYGADGFYLDLMVRAFSGWDTWNAQWGDPLYHETGVLVLTRQEMRPGGFEYESYQQLTGRGVPVERMTIEKLKARFPAWNAESYPDGYFNPRGGWVESGRVVKKLTDIFTRLGGKIHEGVRITGWLEKKGRITGAISAHGKKYTADVCILAAGAWTPSLHPDLSGVMWPVAQDVLHFVANPIERFRPPAFPVFTADVSRTGWYGFPALADGTIKIANHGAGRRIDPGGERDVLPETELKFRNFFAHTFPDLLNAPKIHSRVCFYTDTFDGDFWIDQDPVREGLIVASGGSGHAFKFAPVLGPLIADVVERKPHPTASRFAWRDPGIRKTEFARFEGEKT